MLGKDGIFLICTVVVIAVTIIACVVCQSKEKHAIRLVDRSRGVTLDRVMAMYRREQEREAENRRRNTEEPVPAEVTPCQLCTVEEVAEDSGMPHSSAGCGQNVASGEDVEVEGKRAPPCKVAWDQVAEEKL